MTKIIHLISDLHLCETRPHLTQLLEHYLQHIAPNSNQLFILGDLFELWVGDDHQSAFNQKIVRLLANYSQQGRELFVAHGNRDFLLGQSFAQSINATLINEPYNCQWGKHKVCLMHGDSLCTDDIAYQEFKSMVRNPQWQQHFLSQPLEQRLAYAAEVRAQSRAQQTNSTNAIMDVNESSVIDCIRDNACNWLIHGHTHREGRHAVELGNQKIAQRIVLSDWNQRGHYLEVATDKVSSHYFDL